MKNEDKKKDRNDDWKEDWKKHLDRSKEKAYHSSKRFDILTVTFASGCIYLALETFKFVKSPASIYLSTDTTLLKIGVGLAVLAIILNFISQMTSANANSIEAMYAQSVIDQEDSEPSSKEIKRQDELDKKSRRNNTITQILNISTTTCVCFAIGILSWYYAITF